jgi:hypothetical protein
MFHDLACYYILEASVLVLLPGGGEMARIDPRTLVKLQEIRINLNHLLE